jgi:hypothetical protein
VFWVVRSSIEAIFVTETTSTSKALPQAVFTASAGPLCRTSSSRPPGVRTVVVSAMVSLWLWSV